MRNNKLKDISIILSLFFVAYWIRITGISKVSIYGDEWIYWSASNIILMENFIPVSYIFEYYTPFLSYNGALFISLFGNEINSLRMVSVIFGSLTVPIMYLFGKEIYDRKTGIVAGLLICFSVYHILYSHIFMEEAITIFFITAFLYFFWIAQRSYGRISTVYTAIAGFMLGFAVDAKYLPIFLIPVILIYLLWTEGFNPKILKDKRIILVIVFAFLSISPLIISWFYTGVGFDSLYFQVFGRFHGTSSSNIRIQSMSIIDLLESGLENLQGVLARGAELLFYPWSDIYLLSATLLFFITLIYYIPKLLNREKEGSFLMISIFMYFIVLLNLANKQYYLLYMLPFYLVMLSHLAINSLNDIRSNEGINKKRSVLVVLLVSILLFSSFVTAVTSPNWDGGDYSWTKSTIDFIKNDVVRNNYEGHILVGTTVLKDPIDYSIYLEGINASTMGILSFGRTVGNEKWFLDFEKIDTAKPDYIITNEQRYNYYFTGNNAKKIFIDYKLVFRSDTRPYVGFVLKRKNIQPREIIATEGAQPLDNKNGLISYDFFRLSIPPQLKVGKTYSALVQVKNTGDSRTNYAISPYSNEYMLFLGVQKTEFTLDKGSTHTFEFNILPKKQSLEEFPIAVDLFVIYDENNTLRKKVDSVTVFSTSS